MCMQAAITLLLVLFPLIAEYVIMSKCFNYRSTIFVVATSPICVPQRDLPRQLIPLPRVKHAKFDKLPVKTKRLRVNLSTTLQNHTRFLNLQDGAEKPFSESYYANDHFYWVQIPNGQSYPHGGVRLKDTVYYFEHHEQVHETHLPFAYEYRCEILFNFAHKWKAYGHYLIDYLPILTTISRDMKQKAFFLFPYNTTFVAKTFPLFGLPHSQLLFHHDAEVFRADRLYVVSPLVMQTMPGLPLIRMRALFSRRLEILDRVRPSRYVIHNRHDRRSVLNMDVIWNRTRVEFPHLPLELYNETVAPAGTWTDRLIFYNQMMFLFAVHGSGSLNCIFMQSNTVMFIINTNWCWCSIFPAIARLLHRHGFFYRDPHFRHFSQGDLLNITVVMPIMSQAIKTAVMSSQLWVHYDLPVPRIPVLQLNGSLVCDGLEV